MFHRVDKTASSVDTWVLPPLAAVNVGVQVTSLRPCFRCFWDTQKQNCWICLMFWGNATLCSHSSCSHSRARGSQFLHVLTSSCCFLVFLTVVILLMGLRWVSGLIVLICISLVTKHAACLSRAYWPFVCLPVRVICLVVNHVGGFTGSLHWVLIPFQIHDLQIVLPFCGLPSLFFLKTLFFKSSYRLTAKLRGRYRDFA